MYKVKSFVSIFLAAIMLMTLTSCKSETDNEDKFDYGYLFGDVTVDYDGESDGLYYSFDSSENIIIVANKVGASTLTVPEEINGHPVTEIAERAFYNNKYITTVSIPESITEIGSEAFAECKNLKDVTIGSSLADIGSKAFFNTAYVNECSQEFLIVGDSILLHYAGTDAVVTVPEGVKTVSSAFCGNMTVTEITLPEGVTAIGSNAFASCMKLTKVNLPSTLTHIGERAFTKCTALTEIVIPDSVVEIGSFAYMFCSAATSVKLSASLKVIPNSAFMACSSLEKVEIPSGVTTIDNNAFVRCKNLTSVIIPDSVTEFGTSVFYQASSGLTVTCSEGSAAEKYCKIVNVDIAE